MQRKNFIKTSALLLSAIALGGKNSFARLLAENGYEIKMLGENVGIFTEKGGTIMFVHTSEGTVVVDTQFPDSAAHLIEEIKKMEKGIAMVINTHHHGDHTGGNINFVNLTKRVVAHQNAAKNLRDVATKSKSESKQYFPTETFVSKLSLQIGAEKIDLHYFGAGHTNGDIFVHHVNSNTVHVGDLIFNKRHPFVDRNAGANIKNWQSVIRKAAKKFPNDTKYISGHAGNGASVEMKKEDLFVFKNYLAAVMKQVKEGIKNKMTREEILKAKTIKGFETWDASGIERPLTAAYEELTSK